jgi:hypothetical protein
MERLADGPERWIAPSREASARRDWAAVIAAVCAGALLVASLLQATIRIKDATVINHVAGAWATLASDAAAGTFYRPNVSPDGFGGTRFAPLHIAIHGALIRAGLPPLTAGHLISVFSTLALALAVMVWVRRLGASGLIAFAAGGTLFATDTTRNLLADIRSDTLAAAFCLWGLALWQRDARTGRYVNGFVVALLLALAWASKLTTLYGLPAVVVVAWLDGRRARGIGVALLALAMGAGLYAIAQIASGGRMIGIFASCADAGTTLWYVLKCPLVVLWLLRDADPFGIAVIALALPAAVALLQSPTSAPGADSDRRKLLPALTLLFAAGVTLVIFASPGTSLNHIIDVLALSVICLAACFPRRSAPLALGLAIACAIGAGTIRLELNIDRVDQRADMRSAMAAIPPGDKPVLAENPSVLELAGQPVYMLDAFMYHVMADRNPALVQRVRDELNRKAYRGVVLMFDPRDPIGVTKIERTHYYPGFCRDLLANYKVAYASTDNFALVPRP